jgi:hypothetical protein
MTLQHERDSVSRRLTTYRTLTITSRRISSHFICFLLFSALLEVPPKTFFAGHKPPTDSFKGYVVAVGPKAITVKSKDNIYHVRTFNYSPKVEQQLMKKKLQPGMMITVHYTRGTDVAVKLK